MSLARTISRKLSDDNRVGGYALANVPGCLRQVLPTGTAYCSGRVSQRPAETAEVSVSPCVVPAKYCTVFGLRSG